MAAYFPDITDRHERKQRMDTPNFTVIMRAVWYTLALLTASVILSLLVIATTGGH